MSSILIVCQDEKARGSYTQLLESWGHRVTAVADGWECSDALAIARPDLILLEMNASGLTSYEICKKIKENPKTFHIMVVILTKDTELATRKRCYEVECNGFMSAPVNTEELQLLVNKLLHAHNEVVGVGVGCNIKLVNSLAVLVQELRPDLEPYDFSSVLAYARTFLLKMSYTQHEQDLALAIISFCSIYLKLEGDKAVGRSISRFLEGFNMNRWLTPFLLFVRYSTSDAPLSEAEQQLCQGTIQKLRTEGKLPMAQLAVMLILLDKLKKLYGTSSIALAKLELQAESKALDLDQLQALHHIIIAEEIFADL